MAQRVVQGGHHVPEETIRRRYYTGLINLVNYYLPLVDIALILDNSSGTSNSIIAKKDKLNGLQIKNKRIWKMMQRSIDVSIRTGTPLIVEKNGKIIELQPKYKYVRVPIKTSSKKTHASKRKII